MGLFKQKQVRKSNGTKTTKVQKKKNGPVKFVTERVKTKPKSS